MTDLPNGALADVGALKSRVREILEEAGAASLTMDALCERLQGVYQINMKSHVGALRLIAHGVTKGSAIRVTLAKSPAAPVGHVERRRAKREKTIDSDLKAKKAAPKRNLSPCSIFRNERRPSIVEDFLANGEKVNAARIRRHIAALWDAEANKAKYYELAHSDQGRFADEKAAFDWEGGGKRTAMPKQRAASLEDAAQTPPTYQVAAALLASVPAAAAAVYSYAARYLQPFLVPVDMSWVEPKMARNHRTRWAALQLIAAGRGALRAPACDHTLRVASGATATGQATLRRAVLLRGLGELQELHEFQLPQNATKGTCAFIASMLPPEGSGFLFGRHGASRDAPTSRALASLRVIKAENALLPAALIQQCSATLTELECSSCGEFDRIVPQCARLESLTLSDWRSVPPAAWLGLSQLHTLRGVSLRVFSPTAIAAALPRLHTLHLDHRVDFSDDGDFSADAFYDELLPRLRSFGFDGAWPQTTDTMTIANVPPLPLLEDLSWRGQPEDHFPRRLMGARPSTLNISDVDLVEWLKAVDRVRPYSPAVTSPLARVRALTLRLGGALPQPPFVVRFLRAAPHLRQLTFVMYHAVREDVHWVLSGAFATLSRSFTLPLHCQLRHLAVTRDLFPVDVPVPAGCGIRLRRRHFPGLRRLTVGDNEYPV